MTALLSRISRLNIWAVVALGSVSRVAADFLVPARTVDPYEFGVIAGNVASGRGYSYFSTQGNEVLAVVSGGRPIPSAFMPPAYTTLVTGATYLSRMLSDGDMWVVALVRTTNVLLAAAMVLTLSKLGRELHSRRAGIAAAVVFCVYPPFVYQATQVSASNLYLVLEMTLLLVAVISRRRSDVAFVVLGGCALGLLCLTRAEAILIIPAMTVWLVVPAIRGQAPWALRLRMATTFLVIASLLPCAWLIRSSIVMERPVLTVATTGGYNFWIGNHINASGSQKLHAIPAEIDAEIRTLPAAPDYELRMDAVYRQAALRDVRAEPLTTVVRDFKKLAMLLTIDPYDARSTGVPYLLSYAALMIGGLAGLVAWRRHTVQRGASTPGGLVLLIYLSFNIAIPCLFFVLARAKLPLELVCTLMVGIWIASRPAHRDDPAGSLPRPRVAAAAGPARVCR